MTYFKKLDLLLPDEGEDEPQLLIVIDNQIILTTNSYTQALYALFGVHYVFNLECPKNLKYVYHFIEVYVLSILQKKRSSQYRKGASAVFTVDSQVIYYSFVF